MTSQSNNPALDRAVEDYTVGMGRFLGLNKEQKKALGERYRAGLTSFADRLTAQAEAEKTAPVVLAQRRRQ